MADVKISFRIVINRDPMVLFWRAWTWRAYAVSATPPGVPSAHGQIYIDAGRRFTRKAAKRAARFEVAQYRLDIIADQVAETEEVIDL